MLQYQATPRLSIEVGGQIARLFENKALSTSTEEDIKLTGRSIDNQPTYNKWQGTILGGVAYRLSPQFQVYTNANFGVTDLFETQEISNSIFGDNERQINPKWRQMEVGIRYYFK